MTVIEGVAMVMFLVFLVIKLIGRLLNVVLYLYGQLGD